MGKGCYLLDSNTHWTFDQIVHALNEKHGNRWTIGENDDFVYDQRMQDARAKMPPLSNRLTTLDKS